MNGDDEKRKFFVKEEFIEWWAEAFADAMKRYTPKIEWVELREIDLSSPRSAWPVNMIPPEGFESGNYIKVLYLDGTASLRLDTFGSHEFDLAEVTEFKQLFHKVLVTNTAQSGKKLFLVLGRGDFSFPESPEKRGGGKVIIASTLEKAIDAYVAYSFPWFDAINYNRVVLLCHTTGNSAPNGVEIQQSIDRTHVDFSSQFTATATGLAATVELVGRYVRVSYRKGPLGGHVRLVAWARSAP